MSVHYYSKAPDEQAPLRIRLTEQALRAHFDTVSSAAGVEILDESHDPEAMDLMLALSALEPGNVTDTAVFIGLTCAPEKMLGRNVLVCARPLGEELESLAERYPSLADRASGWMRDVLANYQRCVFVSRSDLAASTAFAPWIELDLVSQFPLTLPAGPTLVSPMPVQIFLHDPDMAGAAEAMRAALAPKTEVTIVSSDTPTPALQDFDTGAIHVHCGYSKARQAVAIAPEDSVANGLYCLMVGDWRPLGGALVNAIKERSYAEFLDDPTAAVRAIEAILDRIEGLARSGLRLNPEIRRFAIMNHQLVEQAAADLDKKVAV